MPEVATKTIVTLSEMRAFLNITTTQTGKDALLVSLLDAYNIMIEDYIGVTLINSTYTESYDGNGTDSLFLKHYPIVSVTSLSIDGTAKVAADYYIYTTEGYIKLDSDTFLTTDPQNVAIVYVAGHGAARANVPEPLKLALKMWVMDVFKGRIVDFASQFPDGGATRSVRMPWDVEAMLKDYICRKWGRVG